jgi:hypothetical protein
MAGEDVHDRLDRLESLVEEQQETIAAQSDRIVKLERPHSTDNSDDQMIADGTSVKVLGELDAPNGTGVLGHNTATSGEAIGVKGVSNSPDGYGVYTPDATRLDGALVGQSLTDGDPVTSLRGTGIGLDGGALTTAYVQDDEPVVGSTGTFWVSPALGSPESSYDELANITAITYGADGYVYAGSSQDDVHRLDPSNLSDGPLDSYDDGATILAIAYGDDDYVYAGGFNNQVHRLDPSNLSGGPLDSYDDGASIRAIAYGDDGYVYAGGNNFQVHRLDPSNLSAGPFDSYDDGASIMAIAYGADGYVYAGGGSEQVHRLNPGVSLSVSDGETWESVV